MVAAEGALGSSDSATLSGMDWPHLVVVLEALWIVGVAIWITSERRPPESTLAWIFALALLPVVGVPVYWLVGPRRLRRKRFRYGALRLRLDAQIARLTSASEAPSDVLRQIALGLRLDDALVTSATELDLYTDGVSAFAAMEEAIRDARRSIDLETYIFEPDATGTRIRDLLAERAAAGVRVRLLVDAIGARAKSRFFAPIVRAGGRVVRFNPPAFAPLPLRLLNFRTHRKLLVVDGRIGFLGGMNVADEQTIGSRGRPPWRDTHLRVVGDAAHAVERAFLDNWRFAAGAGRIDLADFPPTEEGAYRLQVLRSGPDRGVFPIHEFLFTAVAGADERVWISTAYFVPDETLLHVLVSAAHRGVDVRLLLPAQTDWKLVAAAARSFYPELLAAGARIFEYQPAMLHSKALVVDRELALVGSANLDNRSFRLNFEVAAALYGPEAVDRVAAALESDLGESRELRRGELRNRPALAKLAESAARLFAGVL